MSESENNFCECLNLNMLSRIYQKDQNRNSIHVKQKCYPTTSLYSVVKNVWIFILCNKATNAHP